MKDESRVSESSDQGSALTVQRPRLRPSDEAGFRSAEFTVPPKSARKEKRHRMDPVSDSANTGDFETA